MPPRPHLPAASVDPLSAGVIAAELHRGVDEHLLDGDSTEPLAPKTASVCTSVTVLWVQTVFTALQLLALPYLVGNPVSALGLGPVLGVACAYALFTLHFSAGHAKARIPYAVFSGLMVTLGFAGLADASSVLATATTITGIVLAGGALYGVLGHAMDDWFAACARRIRAPDVGLRSSERVRLTAVARRAFLAARLQALLGLTWVAAAAVSLKLVVLTQVPDALLTAAVALVPMSVTGIVVAALGAWKLRKAHQAGKELASLPAPGTKA